MSNRLEREGTFKAIPTSWTVKSYDSSQSVSVVIDFKILAQFENGEWVDWTTYADHSILGFFFVIKKDGTINSSQVEALARSIGWEGSFKDLDGPAPDIPCQINVAFETYNGQQSLKVKWINPADYSPGFSGDSPAKMADLDNRFGSLLRAATATIVKPAEKKTGTPPDDGAPVEPGDDGPLVPPF